ncbi:MAG TPA: PaaI family thioesterase [Candidatus Limnocylindria bacterium]|jgi:acyl-coenzyme A thioesterase PaaI-like protein|nr:PaaI family thioesterase [Candidatus Limnocylindria bacterium]
MSEAVPVDDGRCFACGPFNAEGMHLRFAPDGETGVRAEITLPPRFQGWQGVAHGGIVMMLLDEAMAHACGLAGERGMTAAMEMRFRAPVPLGTPLIVTGTVKWRRRKVLALEATVALRDGTVLASGEGSFVSAGPLGEARLGSPDVFPTEPR